MDGKVISVSRSARHSFSKQPLEAITLIAGVGVEGDAHAGEKVKHRYLVRKNPNAPNLAQVHLLPEELFAELREQEIDIAAGQMGENITTAGLDLLTLPLGTKIHLGPEAIVEVTGLRTPCSQMNKLRPGLMQACLGKDEHGATVRKAGIMALAHTAGIIRPGDPIHIERPPQPWTKLGPV